MEEGLLARETMDIWENIEDMREGEIEDCACAPAMKTILEEIPSLPFRS